MKTAEVYSSEVDFAVLQPEYRGQHKHSKCAFWCVETGTAYGMSTCTVSRINGGLYQWYFLCFALEAKSLNEKVGHTIGICLPKRNDTGGNKWHDKWIKG